MSSTLNELAGRYRQFVIDNPDGASHVETGIRLVSYLAPGSGSSAATVSELFYSASGLLSLLNDAILRRAANIKFKVSVSQERLQRWLTVIEYVEVFMEIAAHGLGNDLYRWLVVVSIQIIKAALRFVLLLKHDNGIQASPPIPALKRGKALTEQLAQGQATGYSSSPSTSFADAGQEDDSGPQPNEDGSETTFTLQRSGRVVRKLEASPSGLARKWKVPKSSSKDPNATYAATPLSATRKVAECMHIARPLVHLLSMGMYGRDSWRPWLLACGTDISSLCLMGDPVDYNPMERSELRRRAILMLLYFLRSPFYDNYSKAKLISSLTVLASSVPGVRLIIRPLLDYLPWWQRIYFYVWMS